MRPFFLSFIALAGSLSFSVAAQAETVTLANGDWAPYLGKDLPGGGPVAQLVSEAFASQGWTVKYEYYPWKRGYEMAKGGELDGSIVWSRNDERSADFNFSDAVLDLDTVVFFNKDKPLTWDAPEDLKGKSLGGVVGYDYGFITADGGYTIDLVTAPENNYMKLAAGRLDGVAEEKLVGIQLAKQVGAQDQIDYFPKPIKTKPYHLIVSKTHPNQAKILETFNKGLAELKAQGRYNGILGFE